LKTSIDNELAMVTPSLDEVIALTKDP
jgi:hypothetical protein